MDSRRLQELRDVYTQLSHQSTGPDGSQAAVVPSPAPTPKQPETHESGRFVASSAQYPVGIANPAAAAAATAAAAAAAAAAASMTNFASSTMYSSADSGQTGWSASSMGTGMAGVSTEAPAASAAATAAAASAVTPAAATGANPSGTQALSVPGAPIPPAALGFMSPNPSENSGLSQGLPPFTNGPLGDRYSLGHVAPAKAPPAADGGGGGGRTMGSGEASSSPARLKREVSSMSASEEQDGGNAAAGGTGGRKKRKRSERNSFYPVSYFEWTEELMAKELPEKSSGSFAAAIFELGLKHSSPKVLMKLMPPKANSLTTEHIKSRLQKYRLHAHRSKDEFLEFFNLRLKDKFADFLTQEGWRSLSPDHGREGNHNHDRLHQHHRHEESEYDSAGGGDGTGGTEGRGSTGPESGDTPAVKVDGQLVGDIRDLGARCVREQVHLQEMLRQHISAQLKLQAEIHEHLTTAACAGAGASGRNGSSGDGSFNDGPAAGAAAATAAIGGGAGLATAEATPPHQQHPPPPPPPPPPPAGAAGVEGLGRVQGASSGLKSEAQCGAAPTE